MTTPAPTRPDGLWLDDLNEGMTFVSDACELTTEAIIAFATEFDPQPFHTGPEAAEGTFFGGLVASGWHTAAITMRLLVNALPMATGIVGGGGELNWPSAAKAGDILRVEGVVTQITRSRSHPEQAWVVVEHRTLNQHDQVRQTNIGRLLAWQRPPI
ncbi:MaoC/PaaZ C-terminal domain-containing protein [Nocardia neocaledoniensis]|uniref:MaoC/PaaZ C-terminal domain-containing protein n=1 Tax=Nocardia neocaledoniensis TaxID=236511 RepID=UPI002455A20D|nr:MaoC/PaaZ C-terminal domain-containing protein [Nocardia neocaledoniensis]